MMILADEERAQLFIQEMSSPWHHPPTHQQLSNKEIICFKPGAPSGGYFCEKLRIRKLVSLKDSLVLEKLNRWVGARPAAEPYRLHLNYNSRSVIDCGPKRGASPGPPWP